MGGACGRDDGAGGLLRAPDRAAGARAGASGPLRPVAVAGRARALDRLDRADPDAAAVGSARGPDRRAARARERARRMWSARRCGGLGGLVRDARGAAHGRGGDGCERQRGERPGGDAVVLGLPARARARGTADGDPAGRSVGGARAARREPRRWPEGVLRVPGRRVPGGGRDRGRRRARGDAPRGRARGRGRRVDAPGHAPLAPLLRQRALPLRPDRPDLVLRPLPARRARREPWSGGRRARGHAGRGGDHADLGGPDLGRAPRSDQAAALDRARELRRRSPHSGADERTGRGSSCP